MPEDGFFQMNKIRLPIGISRNELLDRADLDLRYNNSRISRHVFAPTTYFLQRLGSELEIHIPKLDTAFDLDNSELCSDWTVFYDPGRSGLLALSFSDALNPNRRTLQDATGVISIGYARRFSKHGIDMAPRDIRITSVTQGTFVACHYRRIKSDSFELVSMDRGVKFEDIFGNKESEKHTFDFNNVTVAVGGRSKGYIPGVSGYIPYGVCKSAGKFWLLHVDNPFFSEDLRDHTAEHVLLGLEKQKELMAQLGITTYEGNDGFTLMFNPDETKASQLDSQISSWRTTIPVKL